MPERQDAPKSVSAHETLRVGILLAVVGGFLDAYTYIAHGGVFANAQTGNMVLIGIYAVEGHFAQAVFCIFPIAAFFSGVVATEYVMHSYSPTQFVEWRHLIVIAEIALLFFVGFIPQHIPNVAVNVAVSFICSMQVNSFRLTRGLPYSTTMCTGNLRSAAEKFCAFAIHGDEISKKHCLRYFIVIGAFCAGAALGALLTTLWGGRAVWACCAILAGVPVAMLRKS